MRSSNKNSSACEAGHSVSHKGTKEDTKAQSGVDLLFLCLCVNFVPLCEKFLEDTYVKPIGRSPKRSRGGVLSSQEPGSNREAAREDANRRAGEGSRRLVDEVPALPRHSERNPYRRRTDRHVRHVRGSVARFRRNGKADANRHRALVS